MKLLQRHLDMITHPHWIFCRHLLCLPFFLMSFCYPVFANSPEEKKLYIYSWGGEFSPDVLGDFTAETGIDVVLNVFEGDEVAESILLTGNAGYDLVTPSVSPFYQRQEKLDIYQPLDLKKIPNWHNIIPHILSLTAKYLSPTPRGAPYTWGTTGIAYNKDILEKALNTAAAPTSLNILFEANIVKKIAPFGIYVLDSPQDMLTAALQYSEIENPQILTPEKVERAVGVFSKIQPFITRFTSNTDQTVYALATGEIAMAQVWSGEALNAQELGQQQSPPVHIQYLIPKEGTGIWLHMLAIPKSATHPDNAHKFINFILRPEVAAKNVQYTLQASTVEGVRPLLPEKLQTNKILCPGPSIFKKVYLPKDMDLKSERAITRAWYRIKAGI